MCETKQPKNVELSKIFYSRVKILHQRGALLIPRGDLQTQMCVYPEA